MKPDTDEIIYVRNINVAVLVILIIVFFPAAIIYAIAAPKKPVRVAHAKPPALPARVSPPTTTSQWFVGFGFMALIVGIMTFAMTAGS